jgi:hypothetical protein
MYIYPLKNEGLIFILHYGLDFSAKDWDPITGFPAVTAPLVFVGRI